MTFRYNCFQLIYINGVLWISISFLVATKSYFPLDIYVVLILF